MGLGGGLKGHSPEATRRAPRGRRVAARSGEALAAGEGAGRALGPARDRWRFMAGWCRLETKCAIPMGLIKRSVDVGTL